MEGTIHCQLAIPLNRDLFTKEILANRKDTFFLIIYKEVVDGGYGEKEALHAAKQLEALISKLGGGSILLLLAPSQSLYHFSPPDHINLSPSLARQGFWQTRWWWLSKHRNLSQNPAQRWLCILLLQARLLLHAGEAGEASVYIFLSQAIRSPASHNWFRKSSLKMSSIGLSYLLFTVSTLLSFL